MATLISAAVIRNVVLNAITGRTNGGTINNSGYAYLALSSTTPSYTSTGEITGITEPSGQGYARKLIGHSSEASTLLMTAAANGRVQNAEEIHFD